VTQELEEKYGALLTRLDLRRGVPYTPNWSADADFIEIIVDACLRFKPGLILECSSGLTTLMLARCCQINGEGRVISLEDGLQYADNTRDYIALYDLGGYATVVHAPLQELAVDGALYKWYATDAIPEAGIDMLVIDGPSGFIQKHSRYPALPVCMSRLATGCTVYLDDAARMDEREIVGMWQARYPGLKHAYHETSRGCSVLSV
jgi:predicted O-methyltransferase YrrM